MSKVAQMFTELTKILWLVSFLICLGHSINKTYVYFLGQELFAKKLFTCITNAFFNISFNLTYITSQKVLQ